MNSPYQLSKEEMVILEAFVKGPAFGVLSKLMKQRVEILRAQLETENSVENIRRFQGGITEAKALLSIPFALVSGKSKES